MDMGYSGFSQDSAEFVRVRGTLAGIIGESRDEVRLPTGHSVAVQVLIRKIRQVARFDSKVLIAGETGTGKEIVARAIHALSPRRDRNFVPVNCGAIPAELLESELFGHVKGAFSGAIAARQGRFELAEGGTLFLDEIGEMSLPMQVKLLRVLQEHSFERVGSSTTIQCDVRIIAATHRNLRQRVADGSFREDLYHRLNVVELGTPALRERIEDLPELLTHFVDLNLAEGRDEVRFGRRALAAMRAYPWPGNVRELENLVERLAVMNGGQLVELCDLPEAIADAAPPQGEDDGADDAGRGACAVAGVGARDALPEELVEAVLTCGSVVDLVPCAAAVHGPDAGQRGEPLLSLVPTLPAEGIDLAAQLRAIERRYMEQALERSDYVLTRAATLLGLKRTTLMDKLRRHGLGGAVAAVV
jgi:sigma-54 dependent transcriptional regulator, flagellar regulatory protein